MFAAEDRMLAATQLEEFYNNNNHHSCRLLRQLFPMKIRKLKSNSLGHCWISCGLPFYEGSMSCAPSRPRSPLRARKKPQQLNKEHLDVNRVLP